MKAFLVLASLLAAVASANGDAYEDPKACGDMLLLQSLLAKTNGQATEEHQVGLCRALQASLDCSEFRKEHAKGSHVDDYTNAIKDFRKEYEAANCQRLLAPPTSTTTGAPDDASPSPAAGSLFFLLLPLLLLLPPSLF